MDIIIRKIAPLIILTITILLSSCSDQNSTDVMNEINAVDATDAIDEMEGVDQINEINELYLAKETTNTQIYVKSSDDASTMIEILSAAFENHYERLTEMFDYTPSTKTIIHIYTDLDDFQLMIGRQTEGTYDAEDQIIKVYTPSDLSNEQVRNEYETQLIHEFVHAIIQSINPIVGYIKWLDEGTSFYAANQLQEALTTGQYANSQPPTLEQFEDSPTYFDEYGGTAYYYSGLIVQYFVEQYGMDKFNEVLRAPLNLENLLDTSIEKLYQEWIAHLES